MNLLKTVQPISKRATSKLGKQPVNVVVTAVLSTPQQLGSLYMERPILIDCSNPNFFGWMDLEKDVTYVEEVPVNEVEELATVDYGRGL